ncbi:MAG: triphosphoribosyl-dephospho-CoA synthase [Gemmataceae bacterium]|nr:triphosphoribosyl-dephospho-CoA synthase [Gemmataceae bacterium]
MTSRAAPLGLAECAELACVWEVRARKAGNVNPDHRFRDLGIDEFYRSATAIAPVIGAAAERSVGATVLAAIEATREVVASNTNLGIVLLLAPLAKVPRPYRLQAGIEAVLEALTVEDSRQVFAAIRLANPGGLGTRTNHDVHREPTLPLRDVMALAQDDDLIARQYVNGFHQVLDEGVAALAEGLQRTRIVEDAIIHCQLSLLARHPDSLIFRKQGYHEAKEASERAEAVLKAGWPQSPLSRRAFADLDDWLRAVRNRRNPGTTADLVTASLFAALREGIMKVPSQYPWSDGSRIS